MSSRLIFFPPSLSSNMSVFSPQWGQMNVLHVLDDAEDGRETSSNIRSAFLRVHERRTRRRRHDDDAGERNCLHQGQLGVARSGRQMRSWRKSSSPHSTSWRNFFTTPITIGPRQITGVSVVGENNRAT